MRDQPRIEPEAIQQVAVVAQKASSRLAPIMLRCWNSLVPRGASLFQLGDRRFGIASCFALLGILSAVSTSSADTLVLRDFTILPNLSIERVDADGVLVRGDRRLDWGEIRYGEVAPEFQADFDRFMSELGPSLYRLRYRLELADYANVGDLAHSLQETYRDSTSAGAQLVQLAIYRHELSAGRRGAALAAWLALQRAFDPNVDPRSNLLAWPAGSTDSLWDPELPPIWFDPQEAADALPKAMLALGQIQNPTTASRLYVASLALAAGDSNVALEQLRLSNPSTAEHRDWISILRLQEARLTPQAGTQAAAVEERLVAMNSRLKPLALYELGFAKAASGKRLTAQRGLLDLLRVPADFANDSPVIAAAAIALASETLEQLGDAQASGRLRSELRQRFPDSWQVLHEVPRSPP